MFRILILTTVLSFVTGISDALCQDTRATQTTIVYDPLFWKDKLKLKDWQRVKINEINADFYGALIESSKAPERKAVRENMDKLLNQRSERIWNTFSDRQKNIWKKLESQYSTSI